MSRFRIRRRRDEMSVVEMQRYNPLRVGIVFLVIVVVAIYFGFTKHIPFKHDYRLKAVFATAVNIRPKSPVRIAGVNVGKVTGLTREGETDDPSAYDREIALGGRRGGGSHVIMRHRCASS